MSESEYADLLSGLLTLRDFKTADQVKVFETRVQYFMKQQQGSRFMDDWKYVWTIVSFEGALDREDYEAARHQIGRMEKLVLSGVKIEGLTQKIWKKKLEGGGSGIIYLSPEKVTDFLNGSLAFASGDYLSAHRDFSAIRSQVDLKKINSDALVSEVYLPLALSCRLLNKQDELKNIIEDGRKNYPHLVDLNESLGRISQNVMNQAA